MNLSKFDIAILMSMAIAIIAMNFMIPAMGLVDTGTSTSDVPELDMRSDRFDFAGAFPGSPTTINQGEISISGKGNYLQSLPDDLEIAFINNSDGTWTIRLQDAYATTSYENTTISEGGEFYLETGTDKKVQGRWSGDMISWEYIASGDYSGIVGTLRYGFDIFFWGFGTIITIFTNLFGVVFDVVSFMFGIANWQISTYSAIIASAEGWAPLILIIPSMLLMAELAKITALIVDILWIG